MNENIDIAEPIIYQSEVVVNSSGDFEQRPDIGTVRNIKDNLNEQEAMLSYG